jgi:hypothetical protein
MSEEFSEKIVTLKKHIEAFLGEMRCFEFTNLFNHKGQCIGTVYMFSDEKYSYGKTWLEGLDRENKRANDAEMKIEEILTAIGHFESDHAACECHYCESKRK